MWFLSSKKNQINQSLDLKINFSNHYLYTNEEFFEFKTNSTHMVMFGNPWPRYEIQNVDLDKNNFNWLISCFNENKLNFINFIKGDFVIFIEIDNVLYLFNDHFGISPIFINTKNETIANDYNILKFQTNSFNDQAVAQHILYNRTIGNTTFDINIENKEGANQIKISEDEISFKKYWNYSESLSNTNKNYSLQEIIDFSKENISFFYDFFDIDKTYITLTGGKDSRSALALVLNQGIVPIGINYGSNKSKDIVFAKKLAGQMGFECKTVQVTTSSDQYYSLIHELMNKYPMKSIHRAHRYAAFKEISNDKKEFNVLFNGYLGGELLMGIYPDNLVFTQHTLKQIGISNNQNTSHNFETQLTTNLLNDHTKTHVSFNNEFEAIFTIGLKHHLQDIQLAKKYCSCVYPFFLDIDFIERIFNSNYNFKHVDNRSKNLFKRYKLYKLNCELQYQAFPLLKNIPFAKKGNYSLNDYKKGPLFWSIKKVVSHLFEKKYPPNFIYNDKYISWVMKMLEEINSDKNLKIHDYFNVNEAIYSLNRTLKKSFSESEMLPYTRIIMFSNYLSN